MTTDTRELMNRASTGDADALSRLYAIYRPFLAAYAEKRFPGYGDDIAQDTFIRALRNLHNWQDQGHEPKSWLFVILRRICIDRLKSAYVQRVEPTADTGADVPADDWTTSPERLALRRRDRDSVRAAVAALTPPRRKAIELFHFRGLSIAEICTEMGRTEGAVKGLLYKGRAAMAQQLEASRG